MGDYITYAELVLRYPLIKSWNSGDKNQTLVNSFMIPFAEDRVNASLAPKYSVPFSAGHMTIKDLTGMFCKYYALLDQNAERAAVLWNDVLSPWIERLLDGSEVILTDSGTIEPGGEAGEIWSTTEDYHPSHSMLDAESPYTMVSSERLYDEENERD